MPICGHVHSYMQRVGIEISFDGCLYNLCSAYKRRLRTTFAGWHRRNTYSNGCGRHHCYHCRRRCHHRHSVSLLTFFAYFIQLERIYFSFCFSFRHYLLFRFIDDDDDNDGVLYFVHGIIRFDLLLHFRMPNYNYIRSYNTLTHNAKNSM